MIPTDELEDYPKRTSFRRVLPLVVALAVVAGVAYGVARRAPDAAGDTLPEFTLDLLDGTGTLSSDDLAGHPVVLNFWAGWCGPCREEAPLFERTWRKHRDDGVIFVGVMIRDTLESGRDFADRFGITYPLVWDPDQSLSRRLGLIGLPQTFFVDHEGRFVGTSHGGALGRSGNTTILGPIERDDLEAQVRDLVEAAS